MMFLVLPDVDCALCMDPKHETDGRPCGYPTVRVMNGHLSTMSCGCRTYIYLKSRWGFNLYATEAVHD